MPEKKTEPNRYSIRDIEKEAQTSEEIRPFIRRNDREVKETLCSQHRVLNKWENTKDNLRSALLNAPEQIKKWQLERLKKLVEHAYQTTSFYRDLYNKSGYEPGCITSWEDFESLPIINKKIMVDANFGDEIKGNSSGELLHSARTSGSSGLNMTIYQDDDSVDYRHMLYMRHCEIMLGRGLRKDDWRYGIYFAAERYTSLSGNYPFVTISQKAPVDAVVENIRAIKPALILAFPSYLQKLYESGVNLSEAGVEVVGTNSERSSPEERRKYSHLFGVPVLDEYSSEEMSLIGYECYAGNYHLVEDSGYFELTDKDNEGYGRLVGTSFGNSCMPFIRYDQGDLMKFSPLENRCSCGSLFRTLDAFRGREDEGLFDGPYKKVSTDDILGLCDYTLVNEDSNILQYQIVQSSQDNITLKVQLIDMSKGFENKHTKEFMEKLPELFDNENITTTVEITKEFTSYNSGKRKLIYSQVKK